MSDIANELSRALNGIFTLPLSLDIERPHRFVIFSDQHKGAGDKADEFRNAETPTSQHSNNTARKGPP